METARCPQCDQVLPANAERCPACGTAVPTELVGVPQEANPDVVEPPPADPTTVPRGERRTAAGVVGVGAVAGILLWVLVSPVWALIAFALALLLALVTLYL